ncbi:hypothetical protein EVAR_19033_1 [Eumeta japonica]|uniref:Uncharacterized protein n=1 Tax=Eumeta variegata TaxID=151549 RepID=A0A4C1V8K3_EUMVA|nr:hypothetical protein EVAR_19033_1 [Eumeta japonica]
MRYVLITECGDVTAPYRRDSADGRRSDPRQWSGIASTAVGALRHYCTPKEKRDSSVHFGDFCEHVQIQRGGLQGSRPDGSARAKFSRLAARDVRDMSNYCDEAPRRLGGSRQSHLRGGRQPRAGHYHRIGLRLGDIEHNHSFFMYFASAFNSDRGTVHDYNPGHALDTNPGLTFDVEPVVLFSIKRAGLIRPQRVVSLPGRAGLCAPRGRRNVENRRTANYSVGVLIVIRRAFDDDFVVL